MFFLPIPTLPIQNKEFKKKRKNRKKKDKNLSALYSCICFCVPEASLQPVTSEFLDKWNI